MWGHAYFFCMFCGKNSLCSACSSDNALFWILALRPAELYQDTLLRMIMSIPDHDPIISPSCFSERCYRCSYGRTDLRDRPTWTSGVLLLEILYQGALTVNWSWPSALGHLWSDPLACNFLYQSDELLNDQFRRQLGDDHPFLDICGQFPWHASFFTSASSLALA